MGSYFYRLAEEVLSDSNIEKNGDHFNGFIL